MNFNSFYINLLWAVYGSPSGLCSHAFRRDAGRGHFFSQLGGPKKGSNLNSYNFPAAPRQAFLTGNGGGTGENYKN